MNPEPRWESRELKVVWAPPRYAVNDEPRPGYWAVFARHGAPAGVLETDGVASLSWEGLGGQTDLACESQQLIQQWAAFGYSARTAFNLTRGLLELEHDELSSTLIHGRLPRRREDRR